MVNILENLTSSQQLIARLLVAELLRNSVNCYCVSPGARCIPIIEALNIFPDAKVKLFNDERAAAFWALGYAKATGRPAVLVCTSGTAVANYYPAIVEAAQSGVPMIVLTADRPWELHYANANQTIPQYEVYGSFSKFQLNIPAAERRVFADAFLRNIDQVVSRAISLPMGVVHLNIAFRKPFNADPNFIIDPLDHEIIKRWQEHSTCWLEFSNQDRVVDLESIQRVVDRCAAATRILVLVGNVNAACDVQRFFEVSKRLGAPIFADVHSNLRGQATSGSVFSFYNLYLDELKDEHAPDLILHFGGRPVSDRLTRYLKSLDVDQITISEFVGRQDAHENELLNVKLKVIAPADEFAGILGAVLPIRESSSLLSRCYQLEQAAGLKVQHTLLKQEILTESAVVVSAAHVLKDCDVYLSPSLLCREFEHFAAFLSPLRVIGNRGASGIDGVIASAAGFASHSQRPCVLFIGDQACWHDLSSLALLADRSLNLHVVVFNNNGGSVFNLLETEHSQAMLLNQHNRSFEFVRLLADVPYQKISSISDLNNFLPQLQKVASSFTEIVLDSKEGADFFRNFKL